MGHTFNFSLCHGVGIWFHFLGRLRPPTCRTMSIVCETRDLAPAGVGNEENSTVQSIVRRIRTQFYLRPNWYAYPLSYQAMVAWDIVSFFGSGRRASITAAGAQGILVSPVWLLLSGARYFVFTAQNVTKNIKHWAWYTRVLLSQWALSRFTCALLCWRH